MTLSYVGGELDFTLRVVVDDDSSIPITRNLLVVIQHLFQLEYTFVRGNTQISIFNTDLVIERRIRYLDRCDLHKPRRQKGKELASGPNWAYLLQLVRHFDISRARRSRI